ncbi:uncharacterized protein [Amphiura filiformis]|uniref:uncharacterized protein n=1 Tax=Amphiura filiformis TaxID=82378 RepID=UPI003B2180EE
MLKLTDKLYFDFIAGLDIHHTRKRNFAQEVQKRRQEIAVRRQETGETKKIEAPLLQKTQIGVRNALLKAAPYDSRSKSTHAKADDASTRNNSDENKGLFFQTMRRQHLQLTTPAASSQSGTQTKIEATPSSSLPGNTQPSTTRSKSSSGVTAKDKAQTSIAGRKSLFANDDEPKVIQLQPYVPKSKQTSTTSQKNYNKPIMKGPALLSIALHKNYKPKSALLKQSGDDGVVHDVCSAESKHSKTHDGLQSNIVSNRDQTANVRDVVQQTHAKETKPSDSVQHQEDIAQTNIIKELLKKDAKKNTALDQVQQALIGNKTEKPKNDKSTGIPSFAHSSRDDPSLAEKRRKELQHHLHLTSSGWKRDHSGNWIKDEEVEFDSDEEEPLDLNT